MANSESKATNSNKNLLGTVIYEPDNPKQQVLLVQDMNTSVQKEYSIDKYANINIDGKRHSLSQDILTGNRGTDLRNGIKENQTISFILNKNELGNFEKLDKSFSIERPEVNKSVDLEKLAAENKKLESKLGTVEKFFQNNKGNLQDFNKFLVAEKENKVDLSVEKEPEPEIEKEIKVAKKVERGMSL